MTQYMLSVHIDESDPMPEPDVLATMYADVEAVNQKIRDAGAWVFGGGLHPSSTATVVRADGTDVVTTDGPFAETKEQLGGFWVIEASDLDAALDWARQATVACKGPVEVRPFQDEAG